MLESFKHLLEKPEFPVSPDTKKDTNNNPLEKEERWEAEEIEEHDAAEPPEPEGSADSESAPEEASPPDDAPQPAERKAGAWPRAVAGVAACIGVACIGFYWYASSNDPLPAEIPKGDILASLAAAPNAVPSASPPQPKAAEIPPQPKAAADIPAKPAPSSAPTAQPTSTSAPATPARQASNAEGAAKQPSTGMFGANPFIDLSTLHTAANASSASGLPPIYGNGNRALPEVPRPEVSPELLPSPGEIRTPPSPAGTSGNAATMGGLIRKPNGEAVAIMGDGTVLSEGDTYKGDRRVTFIGGDGITFDDGNTVPFGQNK